MDVVGRRRGKYTAQVPIIARVFGLRRMGLDCVVAEGVGFEPTRDSSPLPVFKTGAFNHSATPPQPIARHY